MYGSLLGCSFESFVLDNDLIQKRSIERFASASPYGYNESPNKRGTDKAAASRQTSAI